MPCKNSRKSYDSNGYYHVYNRGVEKRLIFQDKQDYAVFRSYLRTYLTEKDEISLNLSLSRLGLNPRERDRILKEIQLNNFYGEITLIAYCLMPNHFHFLIHQNSAESMDKFMNSLCTRYTMFFNKKYDRVGPLYQGVYKAVSVLSEEQLLYLTNYIHRNPYNPSLRLQGLALEAWTRWTSQPSSYPEYLGLRQTEWVRPEIILNFFSKTNPRLSYQAFVEQDEDISIIQKIILD